MSVFSAIPEQVQVQVGGHLNPRGLLPFHLFFQMSDVCRSPSLCHLSSHPAARFLSCLPHAVLLYISQSLSPNAHRRQNVFIWTFIQVIILFQQRCVFTFPLRCIGLGSPYWTFQHVLKLLLKLLKGLCLLTHLASPVYCNMLLPKLVISDPK